VTGTLPVGNGGTGTATTFTAGSLVFADASGNYTQNNANLFWNNTLTRLGINTNTPQVALDVVGDVKLGSSATQYSTTIYSATNWNFAPFNVIRNASNTATPRLMSLMLDADSTSSTTIGDFNSIWGIYNASPTTGSTSASLQGAMAYGAYYGHRWYNNGTEYVRIDNNGKLLVNQLGQIGSEQFGVTSGTANATTYTTIATKGGSALYVQQQQTTSVSTAATTILTPGLYVSLCLVHGSDGTNRFVDLVLFSIGTGTVNVISSLSASGSPASRTYSQASSTYKLAMGSGTYTVQVAALTMTS